MEDLNSKTLDLARDLRAWASVLEETEDGATAYKAALEAQSALQSFIDWCWDEA